MIAGLGNPGSAYEHTRHNAGRRAAEYVCEHLLSGRWNEEKKYSALLCAGAVGKEKVLIALPQTMMNASGKAVGAIVSANRIKPDRVIIIHDDSDIVFGKAKLSFNKSSGGHRGVESVRKALKTEKFWRIRIGIQPSSKKHIPAMELVLRPFTRAELKDLKKQNKKIAKAIELFFTDGPDAAMNDLN